MSGFEIDIRVDSLAERTNARFRLIMAADAAEVTSGALSAQPWGILSVRVGASSRRLLLSVDDAHSRLD